MSHQVPSWSDYSRASVADRGYDIGAPRLVNNDLPQHNVIATDLAVGAPLFQSRLIGRSQ
ncbi:MAG TPA: hypothetical protein VIN56_01220 [Candidatus Dormibacteraeota bacterium]